MGGEEVRIREEGIVGGRGEGAGGGRGEGTGGG